MREEPRRLCGDEYAVYDGKHLSEPFKRDLSPSITNAKIEEDVLSEDVLSSQIKRDKAERVEDEKQIYRERPQSSMEFSRRHGGLLMRDVVIFSLFLTFFFLLGGNAT